MTRRLTPAQHWHLLARIGALSELQARTPPDTAEHTHLQKAIDKYTAIIDQQLETL
jgi:hypothetical protein